MRRFAPILVLFACNIDSAADMSALVPTWEGYEARLQLLEGQPINSVIDEWGPPTEVIEGGAGNQLFVWTSKHTYTTPDRVELHETQDGKGVVGQVDRGVEVGVSCKTTLRADAAGFIQSSSAQGAGCVATMPDATVVAATPAVAATTETTGTPVVTEATDNTATTTVAEPTTENAEAPDAPVTTTPPAEGEVPSKRRRRRKNRK